MRTRTLPMLGAALLGFVTAVACISFWSPRAASAQKVNLGAASFPSGQPLGGMVSAGGLPGGAQPLAIQGLDADHFVVVSREPRLVTQIGHEGTAQNMVLTVVTHYTVR